MIIGLTFSNYRSYRDTAEFSFKALDSEFNARSVSTVTLSDGCLIRLVNAAVIFGANASGKSNVIKVISDLSKTVQQSSDYTIDSYPLFIEPYAFDRKYLDKPTKIQLDFIFEGKRYIYDIAGKRNRILSEILKERRNGKNLIIFNRASGKPVQTGKGWNGPKNFFDDSSLLPNQLLMSWIATKDSFGLEKIANYLSKLQVYWGANHSGSAYDRQQVMSSIIKDTNSKLFGQLIQLLKIADLGVATIIAKRNDDKDFKFPSSVSASNREAFIAEYRWDISLGHTTSKPNEICLLNFSRESEGTKAIFSVGARLLNALTSGSFVAYDEINDAIHPALLRLLIKLFQSPVSNPHGAQLLFSTHDSSVADFNTLRSDQVWFVEKKDAVSDLYSAQDFNDVDIHMPFESWYRAGRFGALPELGDFAQIFSNI